MNSPFRSRRLATAVAIAVLAAIVGAAAIALAGGRPVPATAVEIEIRYSRFEPSEVTVPLGVPVTFRLVNTDPIDHEWIVGDAAVHARHRTSAEPLHPANPTEVVLPAMSTQITTITFDRPGNLQFICHLPGHEAYGMVGTVSIVPSL
jgi:uncharacterized cupredoxin-like copper-binding protein